MTKLMPLAFHLRMLHVLRICGTRDSGILRIKLVKLGLKTVRGESQFKKERGPQTPLPLAAVK